MISGAQEVYILRNDSTKSGNLPLPKVSSRVILNQMRQDEIASSPLSDEQDRISNEQGGAVVAIFQHNV